MIKHGKIPDWYDKDSEFEEVFHKDTTNEKITNRTIEKILKKYKAKTVLDLTCGAGSQVFHLLKCGLRVTGSDISKGMLKIAKKKAKQEKIDIKFLRGDMRTTHPGHFDAVITIFNAIGHLTKTDFSKTIRNIHRNLNSGGIYVFDIINLNYVLDKDNIMKMSLERMGKSGNTKIRELQHSIIDNRGILISHTIFYTQKPKQTPKVASKNTITLQLYTVHELKKILNKNGFKVVEVCGIDGSRFNEKKTERIVITAKKK